jgi:Ca-activated chloride channel family protein
MTWLYPLGLLGLLALPVIIVLHLLRERSRRAQVSSLELWRWLENEVRGPRLRRIPLSWILLLQLMTALLLAAAVAQPQVNFALPFGRSQRLVLVVDTSTSMGAAWAGSGTRLDQAKAQGATLLAGLGRRDSAVLIAAGPMARQIADSALPGGTTLATDLAGLRPVGAGNDWSGALALAAVAVLPDHANRIVVLTDGAFEFPEHLANLDVAAEVDWRLVGTPRPNQAVVALAARPSASGALQVFARIANFADSTANQTVTLLADGRAVDEYPVRLEASQVLAQSWTLPPGASTVEVRLAGGDALPADDQAAIGVAASRPIDALLVAAEPATADSAAVSRALESLPGVRLKVVQPGAYVPFERHELTVFYGWLPERWPQGGVLVIEPPEGSVLLPVVGAETVGALPLSSGDPLLVDVDLARLRFGAGLRIEPESALTPVLLDSAGLGLIWRGAAGGSPLVAFTFRLAESNITRRADFPILIANAVAAVLPAQLPSSLAPGEAVALPSYELFPALTLTEPSGREIPFGRERPATYAGTETPGLYLLRGIGVGGEDWQSGFGVNAGSAFESELRLAAEPTFVGPSAGGLAATAAADDVLDLWPLVVVAVLVVLIVEAALAWR